MCLAFVRFVSHSRRKLYIRLYLYVWKASHCTCSGDGVTYIRLPGESDPGAVTLSVAPGGRRLRQERVRGLGGLGRDDPLDLVSGCERLLFYFGSRVHNPRLSN